jgi:putative oxidoreductase
MKILAILSRLALAAIFIYSAYAKLKAPWFVFAASIDSYRMLPSGATIWIAKTLPWFELALGALLVIGFRVKWVAIACGVLLAGFWLSMLRAYLKGMDIDCGCFGPGERISVLTLLRDSLMVILAAAVWWSARRRSGKPIQAAATVASDVLPN